MSSVKQYPNTHFTKSQNFDKNRQKQIKINCQDASKTVCSYDSVMIVGLSNKDYPKIISTKKKDLHEPMTTNMKKLSRIGPTG